MAESLQPAPSRRAASPGAEDVEAFARRHGLSLDHARALLRQHGDRPDELARVALSLRRH